MAGLPISANVFMPNPLTTVQAFSEGIRQGNAAPGVAGVFESALTGVERGQKIVYNALDTIDRFGAEAKEAKRRKLALQEGALEVQKDTLALSRERMEQNVKIQTNNARLRQAELDLAEKKFLNETQAALGGTLKVTDDARVVNNVATTTQYYQGTGDIQPLLSYLDPRTEQGATAVTKLNKNNVSKNVAENARFTIEKAVKSGTLSAEQLTTANAILSNIDRIKDLSTTEELTGAVGTIRTQVPALAGYRFGKNILESIYDKDSRNYSIIVDGNLVDEIAKDGMSKQDKETLRALAILEKQQYAIPALAAKLVERNVDTIMNTRASMLGESEPLPAKISRERRSAPTVESRLPSSQLSEEERRARANRARDTVRNRVSSLLPR